VTHIVIEPAGGLVVHPGVPSGSGEIAGDYFDGRPAGKVHPAGPLAMLGWVVEAGMVVGLERNPVGACVLASLGSTPMPIAGPVVFTGQAGRTYGLTDLDSAALGALDTVYRAVLYALARPPYDGPALGGGRVVADPIWATAAWREQIRAMAAQVVDDQSPAALWTPERERARAAAAAGGELWRPGAGG